MSRSLFSTDMRFYEPKVKQIYRRLFSDTIRWHLILEFIQPAFQYLCSIRKITNTYTSTRQIPSPVHCSSSSWRKEIIPGPNHPSVTVQECLGRVQSQIIVSRPMPRSCVPCYRPLMAGTPQVAAYLSYSGVSQLVDLNSLVNKVNTDRWSEKYRE